MKNKELSKLKNNIAIKATVKIILYPLLIMLAVLIIDILFSNIIAEKLLDINVSLYYFCVSNKASILLLIYLSIIAVTTFLVIRNLNNNIVKTISAMDSILKQPEKEIELSDEISFIENRLNRIRIDLIKSQNEAKEAVQKKDDLIMYMAHDIKTPLTSIIGYLTLLSEEKEISQSMQEKYINISLQKALRVEELTNQFFDITRYNLHDIPLTKQNINLSFLLEQLIEEAYPMLKERGLECTIEKSSDIINFNGDGDKLARAFGNLLKNAINYSYKNTNIEIEITQNENKIQIVFKNKGEKIPEYKLEKIFEKFYRVDQSRATNTGGVGLGLAITKEIIELHNGEIYAKNEGENIEFYIELETEN